MKKILVIQQKMIGDVLVSTILCESLAKAYPNDQIDYLIYEGTYDVFSENEKNYNIIPFTNEYRESKKALITFAKKLRNENYDIVIDAYSKLESWIIVGLSNAPMKISFKKGISNLLYTHLVDRHETPTSNLGLVIEHRLKLLQPLGIEKEHLVTTPHIRITEQEKNNAKNLLVANGLQLNKPIAMLNIIGSGDNKTYPLEYMAKIVDEVAQHNVQILFNYLPKQKDLAEKVFHFCRKETQEKVYFNVLAGSLRSLLSILNECSFVIGNDGGTMNMAKALNKPTFIIFSPWIEKKAWSTFEDGKKHISVHLNDYNTELFSSKTLKEIKKINSTLYTEFHPIYFKDSLNTFVKDNLQ